MHKYLLVGLLAEFAFRLAVSVGRFRLHRRCVRVCILGKRWSCLLVSLCNESKCSNAPHLPFLFFNVVVVVVVSVVFISSILFYFRFTFCLSNKLHIYLVTCVDIKMWKTSINFQHMIICWDIICSLSHRFISNSFVFLSRFVSPVFFFFFEQRNETVSVCCTIKPLYCDHIEPMSERANSPSGANARRKKKQISVIDLPFCAHLIGSRQRCEGVSAFHSNHYYTPIEWR